MLKDIRLFFTCFSLLIFFGCTNNGDPENIIEDIEDPYRMVDLSDGPIPFLYGNMFLFVINTELSFLNWYGEVYKRDLAQEDYFYQMLSPIDKYDSFDVSPDGRYIVYKNAVYQTEVNDVYGASFVSLYGPMSGDGYAWGQNSLYFGDRYDGIYKLDVLSGFEAEVLTSTYGTYDHSVALSTDQKYMVWSHHSMNGTELTLYFQNIADLPTSYAESNIIWVGESAPEEIQNTVFLDETSFLFKVTQGGVAKVFLCNIYSGCTYVFRLRSGNDLSKFYLSPNKDSIVYASDGRLYVVDLSSWKTYLIDDIGFDLLTQKITWSPDGRYLVFAFEYSNYYLIEAFLYDIYNAKKWVFFSNDTTDALGDIVWAPVTY